MTKSSKVKALVLSTSSGRGITSHTIAKLCDCTPSYARKVCMEMFAEGKAAFRFANHQGNAGYKREWVSLKIATQNPEDYVFPVEIQTELFPEWEQNMKQYQIDNILETLAALDDAIIETTDPIKKAALKNRQRSIANRLETGAFHADHGVWTTEDKGADRK